VFKPTYKITAGSVTLDPSSTTAKTHLVKLKVERELWVPCDSCEIVYKLEEGTTTPNKDDPITIELGDGEGSSSNVFKGVVTAVEAGVETITVRGESSAVKLVRTRVNQAYEKQFAGDIVKDLVSQAGLSPGKIENGIQFQRYVVDDNRNAWEHIYELAERCGFVAYVDVEEKLHFAPYNKGGTTSITYGENLIEARAWEESEPVTKVAVFGESPSSSKGADTWHQITKEAVKGETGSGSYIIRKDDWVLVNKDATKSVAEAILNKAKIVVFGQATILGNPGVKLGDAVKLEKMPASSANGEYQVTRVVHLLDTKKGFITIVQWQKPA